LRCTPPAACDDRLAWGAPAVLFSAAVPYAIIWIGVRRGRLTDHHVGRCEQRRTPLLLGLTFALTGLALLLFLGVRRPELVAGAVVMFVVGVGATVVNLHGR
jgi:L-lactate permease